MKLLKVSARSISNLNPREGMPQAIVLVIMTILVMLVHMVLGASFGLPGFTWLVLVTLTVALINPETSFALLLVFFFLQNIFVSLVSPDVESLEGFRLLLGSSFLNLLLTAVVCVPAWIRLKSYLPVESYGLLQWMFLFLAVVTVYTLVGIAVVPVSDVLLYTRVYLTGALFLAVGISYGFHLTHTYTISVIRVLAFILVAWGIVEFLWSYDLYTIINFAVYLRYKFTASGQQEAISNVADAINFSSRSYLNLTGNMGLDYEILRPNGPELHPITYAYCSVFCSLICYIYRSYFLAIATLFIVFLTGAKGPMIMLVMCYALCFFHNRVGRPHILRKVLLIFLASYVAIGLIYGVMTDDYHVVGFFGGLKGFLSNPLGHGIGAGGNLTTEHQLETMGDRQFWQVFGADYGFESAIGVLIYQMGIGAVVFFIFFRKVWQNVWNAALYFSDEPRLVIVPIALAFIFVNGIFQEEAFSPAGWGLWFMFSGIIMVKRWRQEKSNPEARGILGMYSRIGFAQEPSRRGGNVH